MTEEKVAPLLLRIHETATKRQDAASTVEPLLISADVAGPMCGRSTASWWRDHAAGRIPAPIKLGGRTLWRVEELRRWIACGCPDRGSWDSLQRARRCRHE
jgi:predicted DNA-binding transcriptional regulator AlpA